MFAFRSAPRVIGFALFVVSALLTSASIRAATSSQWLPACPDHLSCSGGHFLPDGNATVTIQFGGPRSMESHHLRLDDFSSTIAQWTCRAVRLPSGNCLAGNGRYGGAVMDSTGTVLYQFNPGGLVGWQAAVSNDVPQGAFLFTGTSPPTVAMPVWGSARSRVHVSADEGRTWETQSIERAMGVWLTSPDGRSVWAASTQYSAGLWQTKPLQSTDSKLNFTQLIRVDNGSFPAEAQSMIVLPASALLPGGYSVAVAKAGLYVSTDLGGTWQRSTFPDRVDAWVLPFQGNLGVQAIAARGSVFLSRDRGVNWTEIGRGLPNAMYSLSASAGTLIASGDGVFVCRDLDCTGGGFARVTSYGIMYTRVTEFYNAALDHYFLTGDEAEKAFIQTGKAGDWLATGQTFWAWSQAWTRGSVFVCRFYGDAAIGPNSHFYSASADECRALLALERATPNGTARWNGEGYSFKVGPPNSDGGCSGEMLPVYRAYNNGFARGRDSNHRFVTDRARLVPLIAAGWVEEGIAFCVPPADHE